jgi:hypothetical protein
MPKHAKAGNQNIAKEALLTEVEDAQIGGFIEAIHDEEFVTSYLFESLLKGYKGWRWSVTLTQTDAKHEPTVSEIVMLAGPDSVVAPKWVPWSERLADYKALQAALEEQAKAEAELEVTEVELEAEVSPEPAEENQEASAATAEVSEHNDAEQDADDAAGKPQKRLRWLTRKKRH